MKKAENDKKVCAGREKADAEKARLAAAVVTPDDTVVGKGGKDAITEKERADAIKANLDSQLRPTPKTGTGRRVTVAKGRFARNA